MLVIEVVQWLVRTHQNTTAEQISQLYRKTKNRIAELDSTANRLQNDKQRNLKTPQQIHNHDKINHYIDNDN